MANILTELDRLRHTLQRKGIDADAVEAIVGQASAEIRQALDEHGEAAMQLAIDDGVEKRSSEFINQLRLDEINMELSTTSGNMDFSDPPYPMLHNLLKNAKPMKDGSGVYKVIPVGVPGKDRPKVSTNIYDAWKQVNAERSEEARAQKQRVTPKGSKASFKTATSKQNASTQWVLPAKEKDFSETMANVNKELKESMDDVIQRVIRDYEESFT